MAGSEERTVGIVVERRRIDHPWAEARWQPVAVVPPQFALAPWSVLEEGDGWTRYYAGPATLSLFPGETENYKHNLDSGRPAAYVVLRRSDRPPGVSLLLATLDPGEIDAHSDAGDDLIEALPLPVPLALWLYGFVARHHVERPFHKRKRDRADTEVLARGGHPLPLSADLRSACRGGANEVCERAGRERGPGYGQ